MHFRDKLWGNFKVFDTHLSPGDVHKHGKAGHVVTLAADVGAVSEDHLTALCWPATAFTTGKKKNTTII